MTTSDDSFFASDWPLSVLPLFTKNLLPIILGFLLTRALVLVLEFPVVEVERPTAHWLTSSAHSCSPSIIAFDITTWTEGRFTRTAVGAFKPDACACTSSPARRQTRTRGNCGGCTSGGAAIGPIDKNATALLSPTAAYAATIRCSCTDNDDRPTVSLFQSSNSCAR